MKKSKGVLFKLIFSFVLIVFIFTEIDFKDVWNELNKIRWNTLMILLSLFLMTIYIRSIKWKCLAKGCKLSTLFLANLTSGFYSVILPGQLFGDIGRAAYVIKRENKSIEITTSVIIDQMTGVIALLICGCVGLELSSNIVPVQFHIFTYLFLIILIVGIFFSSKKWFYKIVITIINFIPNQKILFKIKNKMLKFLSVWVEFSGKYVDILKAVMVGIAFQILSAFYYYSITRFLGMNVSMFDWMWINAITTIVLLIPISFGGIGLREGTLSILLGMIGIDSNKAISVSLLMFLINVVFAMAGSLVVLFDTFRKKT